MIPLFESLKQWNRGGTKNKQKEMHTKEMHMQRDSWNHGCVLNKHCSSLKYNAKMKAPKIRKIMTSSLSYQAPSLLNRINEFHDEVMESSSE